MKIPRILLMCMVVSMFVVAQAYSAPKEDKENNGKGQNENAQNEKGNNGKDHAAKANQEGGQSAAVNKGKADESKQQARRSSEANTRREARNRSSQHNPGLNNNNNNHNDLAFDRRATKSNNARHNGEEMRDERASRGFDLIEALNRARWSYNPHDTRGQGNMGKVDMLDPFGFDKDSDRKELYGNNGRPIREKAKEGDEPVADDPVVDEPVADVPVVDEPVADVPVVDEPTADDPIVTVDPITSELLNLAELINIDFNIQDQYLINLQNELKKYQDLAQQFPENTYYASWAAYVEQTINNYISSDPSPLIAFNLDHTIDYSLTFDTSAGLESTTLLVTTTLIAVQDTTFSNFNYVYDQLTGTWVYQPIVTDYFDAGQILAEQTQEVSLSSDGTLSFSYDVPNDLASGGTGQLYSELLVTVTDPISGSTYTTTYDKQIQLVRCPYGKVYNAKTSQPVVGVEITVHYEDGSIVALDKATNKTASNPQITDATGRFGFILQTNRKYYLTAKAEGYEDYKSSIFTEEWHVLREDIQLEPKLEQMVSNLE